MNDFFKTFKTKIGWWILTTLVGVLVFDLTPSLLDSLFGIIKDSEIFRSLVQLIMSFVLYSIYIMYVTYHPNKNVKKLDEPLSKCYTKFVNEDSDEIYQRLINIVTKDGVDLAWEPDILGLMTCKRNQCDYWKNDGLTQSLSAKRRSRMIDISTSFLNWRVCMCHASETNLLDVISNEDKYEHDKEYREEQIKRIKQRWKFIERMFLKQDCKRIIILPIKEWEELKNNHKDKLVEYFNWHIDNHWDAKLYIIKETESPYKLSTIAAFGPSNCSEFTDFVIIKKWLDKGSVVFAQNSREKARIIDSNAYRNWYERWFTRVWKDGPIVKHEEINIDRTLLKNMDIIK